MERKARCHCGRIEPSSKKLPFFSFRGEGSDSAEICKCGYYKIAHEPNDESRIDKRTVMELGWCKTGYVARGA